MARVRLTRRKSPKQSRSRILVDSILEATTRLLAEGGLERTTTNRIADVAGVSVGSLYQYFPNKDTILAHLIERDLTAQGEAYRAMIVEMRDRPLEEVVRAIVEDATDRYLGHPRLIRGLFVHAVRLQQLETILLVRRSIGTIVADLIRSRPDILIADEDANDSAFVIINAIMGVYQTWILSEPNERMTKTALNTHLERLLLGYLTGP